MAVIDLQKRRDQANQLSTEQVDGNWDKIEEFINRLLANPEAATIENDYSAISGSEGHDLLPSQAQQTPNAVQYVEDASDDPRANTQNGTPYAYYEKLETSNGSLENDYRLLSSSEVVVLVGINSLKLQDRDGNAIEVALKLILDHGFSFARAGDGAGVINYDPTGKIKLAGNQTSFALPWKEVDSIKFTITAPFTLTETDILPDGLTKTMCLIVDGNHEFNYPDRYKRLGEYDGTKTNLIVIKHISATLALCQITNFD